MNEELKSEVAVPASVEKPEASYSERHEAWWKKYREFNQRWDRSPFLDAAAEEYKDLRNQDVQGAGYAKELDELNMKHIAAIDAAFGEEYRAIMAELPPEDANRYGGGRMDRYPHPAAIFIGGEEFKIWQARSTEKS